MVSYRVSLCHIVCIKGRNYDPLVYNFAPTQGILEHLKGAATALALHPKPIPAIPPAGTNTVHR